MSDKIKEMLRSGKTYSDLTAEELIELMEDNSIPAFLLNYIGQEVSNRLMDKKYSNKKNS